jgi:cobalt/nickel transport system permease protein
VLDLDRYIARESPIHAADARLKFLLTIAFIVAIGLLPVGSFVAIAIAWAALVVLSATAGLGPFRLSRGAFFALPFMLAALPLVFTRPENPIASIPLGPFTVTISGYGLLLFATIATKSWVSVQAALLLTYTTPFHDLVDGLRRLRLPGILVSTTSFMYRYLAVLSGEASRLVRARASRSADLTGRGGGSIRWRAGVVGGMVGSLFIRSFERSERVYAAMQARGFEGELKSLHGHVATPVEVAWFILLLGAIAGFLAAALLWLPRA